MIAAGSKWTWCLIAMAMSVLLGGLLSPANADVNQDGRRTASTTVDGSYSRLEGNGFGPSNNQCVIYSTLSFNSSGSQRMIQSGLVRCDTGTSIDGTCPGGQVFVERYNGSSYFCTPGYSFNNNIQYDATTYRNSSTSTTFTGHINGVTLTQGGFGLRQRPRIRLGRSHRWLDVPGTESRDLLYLEEVRHKLRLELCGRLEHLPFRRWHEWSTVLGFDLGDRLFGRVRCRLSVSQSELGTRLPPC